MTTVSCLYSGELRCRATHHGSGAVLITDAPVDNAGQGQAFSPTDLLATSVATCMLTIMGITAKSRNWSIEGSTAEVNKHMTESGPRKVERLRLHLKLPQHLSDEQRSLLQRVAEQCPVKRSLDPLMQLELIWS
ncbi:OsmC-like protein [Synechococcus sp. MIT S9509]|uniref:OsmC family protein n=1 Tax=unclassified Synechococcus TaxID=2626047 RepID=UPI0007BC4961|nr:MULTISPECIES: OsmC family protein [unclassified Synechococcus]KZR85324.1 OsmC-like protein [Synechococcus sp. MIT S9504]KZR91475.1 OsmC-like protein [Synechococcus sp. MIT S9509]